MRIMALVVLIWMALPVAVGSARSLGSRELFRLAEIDVEFLAEEEPWGPESKALVRKMLFRIEKDVRPADLKDWSLGNADLGRLAEEPEGYRAMVFHLPGRVVRVEPYRLAESEDDTAAFATVWRCRMLLEPNNEPVEVVAAQVPKAWKLGESIDEPAEALAFFLTSSGGEEDSPAVFLASRVAWYPPTSLGRLGMDVGLLDDVVVDPPPQRNADGTMPKINWQTRQLTIDDHECFYQMLKAVGTTDRGQLASWAREDLSKAGKSRFSVVPLFNRPETQQGRLVELSGTARRILPVRIGESEVVRRFGFDQYYQIYLFTDDSQNNPLVFCVRELPEGLATGDGPGFGERVSVAGFFLKTWSYRRPVATDEGKTQRQLTPLLIGKSAVWYPAVAPEMRPMTRIVGTGLLILVLGVVWWIFRQFGRGDRQFERQVRRRGPRPESEMAWDTITEPGEQEPPDASPPPS